MPHVCLSQHLCYFLDKLVKNCLFPLHFLTDNEITVVFLELPGIAYYSEIVDFPIFLTKTIFIENMTIKNESN